MMKLKYVPLLSIILLMALHSSAQIKDEDLFAKYNSPRFSYVEQMPRAPYKIGDYLNENLHYPDSARAHNIQGRLKVKFVVNEDGRISDCIIIDGIGWGLDEEALRVVSGMPAWTPGLQQGKPVKVYFTLPITFKLEDDAPVKKY